MVERKRVTVHIGVHKTGTSAIQQQLHENAARLMDVGLDYLVEGRGPSAAHHNIGATLRGIIHPGGVFRGDWKEVAKAIRVSPCQDILLSTEILCLLAPQKIAELAAYLKDFDTRIVMTIRNQVEKLQSSYAERTKAAGVHTLTRFLQDRDAMHNADYGKLHQRWADVFGENNIVVLCHEEISGDITANFLRQIGFEAAAGVLLPAENTKENRSWSPTVIELVRQINERLQSRFTPAEYYDVVVNSLAKAGYDAQLTRGGDLFSNEQAAALCAYFRDSNQRLSAIRPLPESYFTPRPMRLEVPDPTVLAISSFVAER
jgi:hypothetical protein